MQVCDCAANCGSFRNQCFNRSEDCDDGIHGVPKHVGGDFVHLFCVHIAAHVRCVGYVDY